MKKTVSMMIGLALSSLSLFAQEAGRFVVDSIQSEELNSTRKVSIYLPPSFDSNQDYLVIVATDGQIIDEGNYKCILDSLICNKLIKPCILIAPFSDETPMNGVTIRNLEYIKPDKNSKTASYFNNHLRFFTQELENKIFEKYSIKTQTPFIFYGCSNGGDFGLTLYSQQEPLFDTYMCLSPINTPAENFNYNDKAKLFVAYGDKELKYPFGINLTGLQEKMQKYLNNNLTIMPYKGGHKRDKWMDSFCTFIKEIL